MPTSEIIKAINELNAENRHFIEKLIFLLIKEQNAGNDEIDKMFGTDTDTGFAIPSELELSSDAPREPI